MVDVGVTKSLPRYCGGLDPHAPEIESLREELRIERELSADLNTQVETLTYALVSNQRIGAALGIVVSPRRLTLGDAFGRFAGPEPQAA